MSRPSRPAPPAHRLHARDTGPARPPVRVLVADDEPLVRGVLVRLLARAGHVVVGEVGTVAEAVADAAVLGVDVVLLDLHLPDGLGIDAARQITAPRAASGGRPPAVVLCTGDPGGLGADDLARAGVIALLPKPVSRAALDGAVRAAAGVRDGGGGHADRAVAPAEGVNASISPRGDTRATPHALAIVSPDAGAPIAAPETTRGRAEHTPPRARNSAPWRVRAGVWRTSRPKAPRRADMVDPRVAQLAALRAAATRYADRLRARGMPATRVGARVAALVRRAVAAESWPHPAIPSALTALVVRWALARPTTR